MSRLRDITTSLLKATPGAWGCCIMGFDGLTVEAQTLPACPSEAMLYVTKISAPLAALWRAGDGPEWADLGRAGHWEELVMAWGACHLVANALGDGHFVALVMGPDGLSGQGRYALRLHRPALMRALFPTGGPTGGPSEEGEAEAG